MSTWITPAGTIGSYTQSRQMTFVFQASSTLGGRIVFELANNSIFPNDDFTLVTTNPFPGVYLGTLTGIPQFVSENTLYDFDISATEISLGSSVPNVRPFSMTVTTTSWNTPAGSIGSYTENDYFEFQFQATPSQVGNTLQFELLNGSYPSSAVDPITLTSSGFLSGTPDSVAESVISEFTIRVKEYSGPTFIGFRDRTFSMTVGGVTSPRFITPAGPLFTVSDSTWVDFQIDVDNLDPNVTYRVDVTVGNLPSGLEINESGRIRGYAQPPVDSVGNPITQIYTFTLELSSISGISRSQYQITVQNQELISGFSGRNPVIFNNNPPSFRVSETDPYKAYYFQGESIGNFSHDNNFIFKIIGHDFEEDELSYEIVGLSGAPLNFTVDSTSGWISGIIPDIGENIDSYAFTARVYKTSNPSKTSQVYYYSLTVVGNIDIRVDWITGSNLGQIINGTVCDKRVEATSREGLNLNYRIVGNNFISDITAIASANGTDFFAFGQNGNIIRGSSDGLSWQVSAIVPATVFTGAVYDPVNSQMVSVGYNTTGIPSIILTADGEIYTNVPYAGTDKLLHVSYFSPLFIALGDNGSIITATNPSVWTTQTSGVTTSLRSVAYNGSTYVVVGDDSTILASVDAATWIQVPVTLSGEFFTGVTWTGSKFIAVGANGTFGTSLDGLIWDFDSVYDLSYRSVYTYGTNIICVGDGGVILRSLDDGLSWNRELSNTYNNLYCICYDSVTTNKWYVAGVGGTILTCDSIVSGDLAIWNSPTLGKLPPNLRMELDGEITGRLAFESTTALEDLNAVRDYSVRVQAYSPEFHEVTNIRTFTLSTFQEFVEPFDMLYIKAMPSVEDRFRLSEILTDQSIIPDSYVYRLNDQYFGKARSVVYEHMFGVPTAVTQDYIAAAEINHYDKKIVLGPIKTAVARDQNNNVMYEVVYSEVIDDLTNANGISINKEIIWPRFIQLYLNNYVVSTSSIYTDFTYYDITPQARRVENSVTASTTLVLDTVEGLGISMNVSGTGIVNGSLGEPPTVTDIDISTNTVTISIPQTLIEGDTVIFSDPVYTSLTPGLARVLYPNSLINMRKQIEDSIGKVNNVNVLPLWMRSQQANGNTLGFTPAWVICYTKPGYSHVIKNNLETIPEFKLNEITFGVDRFEVDRSMTYNYNSLTGIWNTLPSAQPYPDPLDMHDSYIYVPRKTILPSESQE